MKAKRLISKDNEVIDIVSDDPKPITHLEKGRAAMKTQILEPNIYNLKPITLFPERRKAMMTRIFIIVIAVIVACLFSVASGQVPQMMNYQGVLTDSSENRLNGNYNMTFSIYDTSNGGNPLWTQTQNGVSVEQGVFNVLLDIPDSVWYLSQPEMNPRRYIGVSISAHPEMNPRRMIGSVPYAYWALPSPDGDWYYPGGGSVDPSYVYLRDDNWGIARNSRSSLLGGFKNSHTNLGVDCITGSSTEPNNGYCTAGGGVLNTASGEAATVTGGYGNTAAGDFSLAAGKQVIVDKLADHTLAFGYDFTTSAPHAVIFMDTHVPIKVGIGTTSPTQELDVDGTAQMMGFQMPTGASSGYVLTSDASGIGTWQLPAGGIGGSGTTNYVSKFTGSTTIGNSGIYETGSYVGIRTTNPAYDHPWGSTPHQLNVRSLAGTVPLHLYQGALPGATPSLIDFSNYSGTVDQRLGQIGTYGSGNELSIIGKDGLALLAGSSPVLGLYVKSPSGNVGIGTAAPQEKLHVWWGTNVDAEVGRGTTDTDITYVALRNANGTKCYIYPNAAGNGIVVSTTKP